MEKNQIGNPVARRTDTPKGRSQSQRHSNFSFALFGHFHADRIGKESSAIENHSSLASIEGFCILVLHGDCDFCMLVEESIAIITTHPNSLDRWVVVAHLVVDQLQTD